MRAAIYIRVSTEDQAKEGYSIDSQKEVCMRWIQEKKYDLVAEYIDDGYSSKSLKRPSIQRMIKEVPARKFDVLVFWRLNRLTRSVKDKVTLFELFDRYNVSLKSMSEELDTTTASGRMVTNVLVSVAQGEREQTAENVFSTMYEQALKGKRNGAVAPFGYDLVNSELIVNPAKAEIVKRIFKMYQQNYGALAIAKQFNREGVPYKNTWNYYIVQYIINNPVYCGKLRWNYRKAQGQRTGKEIIVPGSHEPIISEEEFNYVQKLKERRWKEGKKATSEFPYTGLLRCSKCGYSMIGYSRKVKHGKKRYYRCLGRVNYGICNMPFIAEDTVTEAFLSSLELPQDEIEKLLNFDEAAEDDDNAKYMDQLKNELDTIQRRKRKWQEAYANDVISLDDLRQRTAEDRAREDFIRLELSKSDVQEKSPWTKEEIIQQLRELRKLWYNIENEAAKKNFLNDVFESIVIHTDVTDAKGGPGRFVPITFKEWKFKGL